MPRYQVQTRSGSMSPRTPLAAKTTAALAKAEAAMAELAMLLPPSDDDALAEDPAPDSAASESEAFPATAQTENAPT
eukprot:4445878-Pyramimonas_sp.AAC.1